MIALIIKVLPATNTKPARIKATNPQGQSVVSRVDVEMSERNNAFAVACKMLHKHHKGLIITCLTESFDGYVAILKTNDIWN